MYKAIYVTAARDSFQFQKRHSLSIRKPVVLRRKITFKLLEQHDRLKKTIASVSAKKV